MIGGSVKNRDSIRKIQEKIDSIDGIVNGHKLQVALTIREAAEIELRQVLGDKMKHFSFDVVDEGMKISIKLRILDDIGKYIFYGTQPHNISSSSTGNPMPIGGGKFVNSVNHPGTKGLGEEIMQAMGRAIEIGKISAGSLGAKL